MSKTIVTIIFIIVIAILGYFVYQPTTSTESEQAIEKTKQMPDLKNDQDQEKEKEASKKISYMDVSVKEAKILIEEKNDLIILDVSPRYADGHLPGAINYYVGDGSLDRAIPGLNKDKEYLVYCHVDSAAILGAQKLIDAGFETVYRLEGNYAAWVDAGYPIEK